MQNDSSAESGVRANTDGLKQLLRQGADDFLPWSGDQKTGSIAAHDLTLATKPPKQFKLVHYDICKKWSLEDWVNALVSRWKLRRDWLYAGQLRQKKPKEFQEGRDSLQCEIMQLLNNPAYSVGEFATLYKDGSPIADETVFDYFSSTATAEDPRYSHWFECFQHALANFPERGDLDGVLSDEDSPCEPADLWPYLHSIPSWKMLKEVGDFFGHYSISVNLGASDDRLIKEFKAWIRMTRRESGQRILPKAFGQSKFDDWHQSRLLPYLDLTIWAEIHGLRITNDKIGMALFPDSRGGAAGTELGSAEHIRKTIKPYAEWVVSETVITALKAQLLASRTSGEGRKQKAASS